MRPQIFGYAFSKLFFLMAVLLIFPLIVLGQDTGTPKCAETDYNCLIAKFGKEISSNPNDAEAYYKRGTAYSGSQRYERAIMDYDKAISLNPKFADAYYGRGYIYIQLKSYAAAIKEFNRVKELDPANANADVSLKYIDAMIQREDLPIEEYDNLVQLDPTKAEYYYRRARLHHKAKNFFKAIEDSSKAIELKPNFANAYLMRAASNCDNHNRKLAMIDVARYERLIGKSDGRVCYINIEQCPAGDDECLMELFTEGIDKPKELAGGKKNSLGNYYAGRAVIYYKRGAFDRALGDFENAERNCCFERNYETDWFHGNLLFQKGKYDEALKKFIFASQIRPESALVHLGIGMIYLTKREFDMAFESYEKAIFLNPRLSKAYLGRGAVYLERATNYSEFENDTVKAAETYRKAIKDFNSVIEIDLGKTPSEVYIKRAKAYERLGEQAKADADRAKAEEIAEKP